MKTTFFLFVLTVSLGVSMSLAEETSSHRIVVPDSKGNPVKAVMTFSDQKQAIEIEPVKGNNFAIPYQAIDKVVYEYTRKHQVTEGTLATAPIGVGVIEMVRKSRIHWLEINYHNQEIPRTYVVRMDKHNYLRILEAVKAHTGKDAEILGNADKRKK